MTARMKGSVLMIARRPRGTRDILPDQMPGWHHLETTARDICQRYGYGEIRTPLFEHTELFFRGVGQGTDIVDKEMYTFTDRGDRSLTLRPESTAPVMRAYLEEGMGNRALPVKLFYVGFPCFRYERPQAARYRQHHQFGVEVMGSPDPMVDVEVMALAIDYLQVLGLSGFDIRLNSIGCPECRGSYRGRLVQFLDSIADLCPSCHDRKSKNPMRVLDCKSPSCRQLLVGAPRLADHLCPHCQDHLSRVRDGLSRLGLAHELDPLLVRGLDYYTHTVFEIHYRGLGAQDALCGGGRYDGLAEALGGKNTPGMGFGMGMERLLLALDNVGNLLPDSPRLCVFLVTMGDQAHDRRLPLLQNLRHAGLSADADFMARSVKAQLRLAGRVGARAALIVGDDEIGRGTATLRDLDSGQEMEVPLEDPGPRVCRYLGVSGMGEVRQ